MQKVLITVAITVQIIENNITLAKNIQDLERIAFIEQKEIHKFLSAIRNIKRAFGNGIKKPSKSEIKISKI